MTIGMTKMIDTPSYSFSENPSVGFYREGKELKFSTGSSSISAYELAKQFNSLKTFSERMEEGQIAKSELEDFLMDKLDLDDWGDIWMDPYDNSLEISKVPADYRIPFEKLDLVKSMGFSKVYVNHVDGWETHYCLWKEQTPETWGWRTEMHLYKKTAYGLTKEE